MFPYAMLATSPLFCYPDWPRNFFAHFPSFLRPVLPLTSPGSQPSPSCVYEEIQGSGTQQRQTPAAAKSSKLRLKHKLGAIFTVLYLMEQFFLPYSHFITQVLRSLFWNACTDNTFIHEALVELSAETNGCSIRVNSKEQLWRLLSTESGKLTHQQVPTTLSGELKVWKWWCDLWLYLNFFFLSRVITTGLMACTDIHGTWWFTLAAISTLKSPTKTGKRVKLDIWTQGWVTGETLSDSITFAICAKNPQNKTKISAYRSALTILLLLILCISYNCNLWCLEFL